MKYIDSITRIKKEKNKVEDKKSQRFVTIMRNIIKKGRFINFYKKKTWLISFVIFFVIVSAVGVFISKKNNLIVKNKGEIIEKEEFVSSSEAEEMSEELNRFHIKINTEEFKVDTDIIEGETDDDLHKGVVHQKGSSFPSQYSGNVVITGHRWYPGDGEFSKVFQNMDKLKEGDEIIIEYRNKKYIYAINKKEIIEKTDTKFLAHTTKPQLTLYTCHPKFTSKLRLVYVAGLKSVQKNE